MSEKLNSQERLFVITQLLCERHITGMKNKELSLELRTSEANICRDMTLFEKYGWVVKRDSRWRLSPHFGGIAGKIMQSYQTAKLRLTEDEAIYASAMQ